MFCWVSKTRVTLLNSSPIVAQCRNPEPQASNAKPSELPNRWTSCSANSGRLRSFSCHLRSAKSDQIRWRPLDDAHLITSHYLALPLLAFCTCSGSQPHAIFAIKDPSMRRKGWKRWKRFPNRWMKKRVAKTSCTPSDPKENWTTKPVKTICKT